MANAALSNADRKKLRKATPAKPRVVASAEAHVVRVAAEPPPKIEQDRDGFVFLSRKRLSPAQVKAGIYYRDLFRFVALYTGADVKDSIERLMTSGGGAGGGVVLNGTSFTASAARAELFRLRWVVSGGQVDVLSALDGVCGIGHTLLFLAGGKRQREEQLMQSLRIGLDLVAADIARRAAKPVDVSRE